MRKIKYVCKNCGWETSIYEEWGDLTPKRCMNKKCNASFILHPELLQIIKPEVAVKTTEKRTKKKENLTNNNAE